MGLWNERKPSVILLAFTSFAENKFVLDSTFGTTYEMSKNYTLFHKSVNFTLKKENRMVNVYQIAF